MNSCVVLLVVVNALSCLAGHDSKSLKVEPGCNDMQKGVLLGTPIVLSYSIPPQTPSAFVNLYTDFYLRCPYGPSSVVGVYVKSCESCANCMASTLAIVFNRSPSDQIDIYRSATAIGYNSIQVTVYCGLNA